ncbi:ABC transporter substrate-binding protein [Modicisalibacter tunisiensis]|uniref:ABC transporter substrate-binding protein n=2 Tax=Halomonadaceae TaxID=28256 RepID=A0ABS7WUD8_9GAMM|nr:ABC transporter substrate-binding protein [Modicisalibacter tunisiensis]MBZ9566221.1 ABC transporter substrate-binding protein [Modicisalibacter tunisiensis]
MGLAACAQAQAAETVRIAEQYGIVYLPLHVIRDQGLLKKEARQAGIELDVEWKQLSGGANVNNALLSDSIDIAAAGVGPLLTAWDRTRGSLDVKAIASLGNFPTYLVTNNPDVKTLADFSEHDRIAVPAVKVSVQARFLQMAAAKAFGQQHYAKLDDLTVSLPHPDATNALVSGGTELTAHFSNLPYQYQELADPDVHKVLDSYDILGGPVSPVLLYATAAYRKNNPELYQAFLDALQQASEFIADHPAEAVATYKRVTGSKLDNDFLEDIITDDAINFSPVPNNTYPLAKFLHDVGAIRHSPASWKDYFFPEAHDWEGS